MEKLYPWRIGAIFNIIRECFVSKQNLDVVLKSFFIENKKLGKRDRVFIQDVCFDFVRFYGTFKGDTFNEKLCSYFVDKSFQIELITRAFQQIEVKDFQLPQVNTEYSFLEWMYKAINEDWPTNSKSIFEALNSPKSVYIRLNDLAFDLSDIKNALEEHEIKYQTQTDIADSTLLINSKSVSDLNKSQLNHEGMFEYQDGASQTLLFKCKEYLSLNSGAKILDLCAGEGGKSVQLSQIYPNATLFAHDIVYKKLKRLEKRFMRLPKTQVPNLLNTEGLNGISNGFDLVLIDAPCSGTGTYGRLPVQKYFTKEVDVDNLMQVQRDLLGKANGLLRNGGYLIYSTCSILKRENNHQVDKFIKNNQHYKLHFEEQILPTTNHDGLYVALLQSKS